MQSPRLFGVGLFSVALVASANRANAHAGTNGSKFPNAPLPAPAPGSLPYSTSQGVRVLGHVDPGGGFNSDVVAFKGFAYLGSWGVPSFGSEFCPSQGVRVYDLANPRKPKLVSTFGSAALEPDLLGTWTEKVMVRHVCTPYFRGELAVASLQSCGETDTFHPVTGFGVWDVTNPARPRRLGLYRSATLGVHEFWLQPRPDHVYAYVALPLSELLTGEGYIPPFQPPTSPGAGDFRIVDLTDPTHPVELAQWGAWRNLGIQPYPDDGQSIDFAHSVFGVDDLAYVSYWDLGTLIFDVSNPRLPRLLGKTEPKPHPQLHAHSSWLAEDGRLLIQTSEDFDPEPEDGIEAAWGYVRFFDVSRPSAPRQLSSFEMASSRPPPAAPDGSPASTPQPPGYFSVHDPKVVDHTAFFSWYSEGVVAVDIRCPLRPKRIAQFVPEPSADPRGFFGTDKFPFVWGTFPYQDYILASDINSGLWVFDLQKRDATQEDEDYDKDEKDKDDKDKDYDSAKSDASGDASLSAARGGNGRGGRRDRCDWTADVAGSVGSANSTVSALPVLGSRGALGAGAALLAFGWSLARRRARSFGRTHA